MKLLNPIITLVFLLCSLPASGGLERSHVKDPYEIMSAEVLFDKSLQLVCDDNNPDSALLLLEAINLREKRKDLTEEEKRIIARSLNQVGSLYILCYKDYAKAASQFLKAKKYAENNNIKDILAETQNNLGCLMYEEGVFTDNKELIEKSVSVYRSAFNLALDAGNYELAEYAASNCGLAALESGDLSKVRDVLDKAVKIRGVFPTLRLECESLLKWSRGDLGGAFSDLEEAEDSLEVSNEQIRNSFLATLLLLKAQYMFLSGKENEGREQCLQIIDLARKSNDNVSYHESCRKIFESAQRTGDKYMAREYELMMYKARVQTNHKSLTNSIEKGKNLYEFEELRDELIRKDTRIQEYDKRLLLTVVFSIVLLGLLCVLFYKYRQVSHNRKMIVKRDQELFSSESVHQPSDQPSEGINNKADSSESETRQGNDEDSGTTGYAHDTEHRRVFDKVREVIATSDEVFEEDFTAARLAELAGERQSVISAAIQSETGSSLSTMLAERRTREAARRMLDKVNYGGMTIEAIAQSVGYKSRSHFSTVFKRHIGMSPTDYFKESNRK